MADETKGGWLSRLTKGLRKSADALSDGVTGIFTKAKLDDETLEELEELLITSDLGVSPAASITAEIARTRYDKEVSAEEIRGALADQVATILEPVARPLDLERGNRPHVILMTGVNGSGKTTTIGKLAAQLAAQNKRVMLAAGDTFRAAAIEQLEVWGQRVGVPVVKAAQGADPASVAYAAMDRALEEDIDILIVDTAGRLQNRRELMDELAKVVRVIGKKLDGAPHDTILVLDATTGQNALRQVEVFQEVADISGLVMTKLDGSAKGGVLVACAEKFKLPVHSLGVGEGIEDLQPFRARDFARALVGIEENVS